MEPSQLSKEVGICNLPWENVKSKVKFFEDEIRRVNNGRFHERPLYRFLLHSRRRNNFASPTTPPTLDSTAAFSMLAKELWLPTLTFEAELKQYANSSSLIRRMVEKQWPEYATADSEEAVAKLDLESDNGNWEDSTQVDFASPSNLDQTLELDSESEDEILAEKRQVLHELFEDLHEVLKDSSLQNDLQFKSKSDQFLSPIKCNYARTNSSEPKFEVEHGTSHSLLPPSTTSSELNSSPLERVLALLDNANERLDKIKETTNSTSPTDRSPLSHPFSIEDLENTGTSPTSFPSLLSDISFAELSNHSISLTSLPPFEFDNSETDLTANEKSLTSLASLSLEKSLVDSTDDSISFSSLQHFSFDDDHGENEL